MENTELIKNLIDKHGLSDKVDLQVFLSSNTEDCKIVFEKIVDSNLEESYLDIERVVTIENKFYRYSYTLSYFDGDYHYTDELDKLVEVKPVLIKDTIYVEVE